MALGVAQHGGVEAGVAVEAQQVAEVGERVPGVGELPVEHRGDLAVGGHPGAGADEHHVARAKLDGHWAGAHPMPTTDLFIAPDAAGELYVCDMAAGAVYRITAG